MEFLRVARKMSVLWLAVAYTNGCRDVMPDPGYCQDCPGESAAPGVGTSSDTAAVNSATDPGSRSQSTSTTTAKAPAAANATDAGSSTTSRSPNTIDASTPDRSGDGGVRSASSSVAGGRASSVPSGAEAGMAGSSDGAGGRGTRAGQGGSVDAGTTVPKSPCGAPCTGDTPVCDETRRRCVRCTASMTDACGQDAPVCTVDNTCVQCLVDAQCSEAAPLCDASEHRCVSCLGTVLGSCAGSATPACDDSTHECVECSEGQTEACIGTRPKCEAGLHRCVECLSSEDCSLLEHPRCESHACSGCRSNADCRDLQARVCNLSGACVQCVQQSDCLANEECDQSRHACSPKPPPTGTKLACDKCELDSECAASGGGAATCAPLAGFGRYCFEPVPTNSECRQPFHAQDVPGKQGKYCMPADKASCEALALVGSACPAAGCGPGGRCSQYCTIACSGDSDCPTKFKCSKNECVIE